MVDGCDGPHLALALDEQKDTNIVYEIGGYTFLVETPLMEKAKTPCWWNFIRIWGLMLNPNSKYKIPGVVAPALPAARTIDLLQTRQGRSNFWATLSHSAYRKR